jgi:hypothetical protein
MVSRVDWGSDGTMEQWIDGLLDYWIVGLMGGALTASIREAMVCGMTKVEEIKAEIDKLSFQERCELNALLNPLPDDEWDRQMRADAEPGGKLHKLLLEAEADARTGELRDFPRSRRK